MPVEVARRRAKVSRRWLSHVFVLVRSSGSEVASVIAVHLQPGLAPPRHQARQLLTRASTGLAVWMVLVGLAGCATGNAIDSRGRSPVSVVEAKFAAVNRQAVDDIVAFYASDAVLTAPDFCGPRHGRVDVARTYQAIFAAVRDAEVTVLETVSEGNRVAVRFVLRGHVAGRTFALVIMNFFTVSDGLIIRDDGVFDNGGRQCTP